MQHKIVAANQLLVFSKQMLYYNNNNQQKNINKTCCRINKQKQQLHLLYSLYSISGCISGWLDLVKLQQENKKKSQKHEDYQTTVSKTGFE